MHFDYRRFAANHPRAFRLIVALKKIRTHVALALVAWTTFEAFADGEPPLDLDKGGYWVTLGLLFIVIGAGFRLAAMGKIRKHEDLATTGVYSLCRHPLYLGSMLATTGFCILLNDLENDLMAAAYFAVFYTLSIVWEEIRLAERFGEKHADYCRATPLLLPRGAYRSDGFSARLAWRNGGAWLVTAIGVMLVAVEVMAETIRPR